MYVNSTPYCTNIELEHHRGPCKCECSLNQASCNKRQIFLPDTCKCQCQPGLTREKIDCVNSTRHIWDIDTCQCTCKNKHTCKYGQYFETDSCMCLEDVRQDCDWMKMKSNVGDFGLQEFSSNKVYIINFIMLSIAAFVVTIVIFSLMIFKCSGSERRIAVEHETSEARAVASGDISVLGSPNDYTLTLFRNCHSDSHIKT